MDAVSYTHLDVYKRQVVCGSLRVIFHRFIVKTFIVHYRMPTVLSGPHLLDIIKISDNNEEYNDFKQVFENGELLHGLFKN